MLLVAVYKNSFFFHYHISFVYPLKVVCYLCYYYVIVAIIH